MKKKRREYQRSRGKKRPVRKKTDVELKNTLVRKKKNILVTIYKLSN